MCALCVCMCGFCNMVSECGCVSVCRRVSVGVCECGSRHGVDVCVYVYMSGSRRLQQYSSLRLALCGATMCDADMVDAVGGEATPTKRHGVLLGQSRGQGKEGKGGEIFHKNA